ncbi:hypothetical protein J4216_00870 [Candidatus Woesearchaeota archaeon]|nr:hypothetical protein [Candidatus Woesearchaeota archaeon]
MDTKDIIFIMIVIIAIILFLRLDKRLSLVNRILIATSGALILFLLFLFVSAILGIILLLIGILLIISLLNKNRINLKKR